MGHSTNFFGRKKKPFRPSTIEKFRPIAKRKGRNFKPKSKPSMLSKNNKVKISMKT